MRNIRLVLSYDGSAYAGWQVQPTLPTVQGAVETAIQKLTGEELRILAAGRTDAGVHALGQVANFRTRSPIPPEKWRAALQTKLPADIVVRHSDEVPYDFHATFSAVSKRYRYVIHNSAITDPFVRKYAWSIYQPLDVEAMHAAAQVLVGRHDFRSFESHWPNKATSVRTVSSIEVYRASRWCLWSAERELYGEAGDGEFVCLEIEADGFLYNMVRAITGTLLNVGRGTWSAADVERVLHAEDRAIAGGTAPAWGLFLVHAVYPEAETTLTSPVGVARADAATDCEDQAR